MIEIKCDENVEKQKNVRTIPKNIRQIGESSSHYKIYVEDYVITYLNQLAHPTNTVSRGAILLGEWVKQGTEELLFISGAVEANNLSFDIDEIQFTNETWTEIYQEAGKYFSGINVVGWFLSRLGYSVALSGGMETAHSRYFKGDKTILYLLDALEQEDAFYISNNGHLQKLPGYYIYYDRNTPMQDYLVEHQVLRRYTPQETKVEYKDSQILHNYHEIMAGRKERKEEKRVTGLLYVTSALLTLVFLAMGISIVNNYDRIKNMQASLEQLAAGTSEQDVSEQKGNTLTTASNPENEENGAGGETKQQTTQAEGETTQEETAKSDTTQNTAVQNTQEPTEENTQTETAQAETTTQEDNADSEVMQATSSNVDNYYTVQTGDTLLSICQKVYHSEEYVDMVKRANEISDGDVIYPGQQIVLPSID